MKTLPDSENAKAYIERKKEGLLKILRNCESKASKRTRAEHDGRNLTMEEVEFLASQPKRIKAAMHPDFALPKEFPRDEYGVEVGNYYDGVRFIRDAIRQCGGAIPLDRLETRIGATKDLKENIGNIRQFLDIHDVTFAIDSLESNNTDVAGPNTLFVYIRDEPPAVEEVPTFQEMHCPDCGLEIKGLVLPKHRGSRICISLQLMKGSEGEKTTPIMRLAAISLYVSETGTSIDDGDIDDFAQAINEAGDVPRYRYSSRQQFNHLVLRAIKVVRNKWTSLRSCSYVKEIFPFHEEDRSFIHFFQVLGKNMKRLPLSWIDMGEIEDMCGTVLIDVKDSFPPPPRPADPEIAPTNQYPGLLFAEELVNDEEDINSEVEIEYSDDEATQFEYAAMPSMAQLILSVGNASASHEVLESLKAHTPVLAGSANQFIKTRPDSASAAQNMEIQEIKQRILSESSMALPRNREKPVDSSRNVSFFNG
ncbi:hypothetical protein XU18_1120 [Perkinsela sp. CCAP 1560/4]|nr:hypothetical protein XU18_1120 [Perkinsela sp. CCAP 1560/4]|eukprot:KNH08355.1 hypothetical protein XU18_1120 [Perkinsela sp. CCAP 1560/4]